MKRSVLLAIVLLFVPVGLFQFCAVRPPTQDKLPDLESVETSGQQSPLLDLYYAEAHGKIGEELKRSLHNIVRGHRRYAYSELWDIVAELDADPSTENHVVLLYSQRSQSHAHRDRGTRFDYASAGYTLIDSWNREHVWPKSHGFPEEKDTAYTDLHHIRPADRTVNSAKNTRSFHLSDKVYLDNGNSVITRNKIGVNEWSWEPPDEVKGDIARMLFYMVVRYEGPDYDLELVDEVVGRNTKEPIFGKLSTLLDWHQMDPVDAQERRRNDLVYLKYQGNRNPFVDYPEWVYLIWN